MRNPLKQIGRTLPLAAMVACGIAPAGGERTGELIVDGHVVGAVRFTNSEALVKLFEGSGENIHDDSHDDDHHGASEEPKLTGRAALLDFDKREKAMMDSAGKLEIAGIAAEYCGTQDGWIFYGDKTSLVYGDVNGGIIHRMNNAVDVTPFAAQVHGDAHKLAAHLNASCVDGADAPIVIHDEHDEHKSAH